MTPLQTALAFRDALGLGVHIPRGQHNALTYNNTTIANSSGSGGYWAYLAAANLTHVAFSYPWTGNQTVANNEAPRNVSSPSVTDSAWLSMIQAIKNANAAGLHCLVRLMDNLDATDGASATVLNWVSASTAAIATSGIDPTMNLICVWGEPVYSNNATWNPLNIAANKRARANLPQSGGWILGGGGANWNACTKLSEGAGRALSQLPDGSIDYQVVYLCDEYPDKNDLVGQHQMFVSNMKSWADAHALGGVSVPIILHEAGDFNPNIANNSNPGNPGAWANAFGPIVTGMGASNWGLTLWDIHNNDGAYNMATLSAPSTAAMSSTIYNALTTAAARIKPSGTTPVPDVITLSGDPGSLPPGATAWTVTASCTTLPQLDWVIMTSANVFRGNPVLVNLTGGSVSITVTFTASGDYLLVFKPGDTTTQAFSAPVTLTAGGTNVSPVVGGIRSVSRAGSVAMTMAELLIGVEADAAAGAVTLSLSGNPVVSAHGVKTASSAGAVVVASVVGSVTFSVTGDNAISVAGSVQTTPSSGTKTGALLGSGNFLVPADWNSANNLIEVVAPGGGGANGNGASSDGGGGGAYSAIANFLLTPGLFVAYSAGTNSSGGAAGSTAFPSGSNGGDGWFNGSGIGNCSVGAKAGLGGTGTGTGGAGGPASGGIGTTRFSGGSGRANGGGGGAGGPNGFGAIGGSTAVGGDGGSGGGGGGADNGSFGQNGSGGVGGTGGVGPFGTTGGAGGAINNSGKPGSNGGGGGGGGAQVTTGLAATDGGRGGNGATLANSAYGPGGGGGMGGYGHTASSQGGDGGSYGGGGGPGATGNQRGGNGGIGVIVYSYTPAALSLTISGVSALATAGALPAPTVIPTPQAFAGLTVSSAGTAATRIDDTATLLGKRATSATGSLSFVAGTGLSLPLTSVQTTAAAGTVIPGIGSAVAVLGAASSGLPGSVARTLSSAAAGVILTALAGPLSVLTDSGIQVGLPAGDVATAAAGSTTTTYDVSVSVFGDEATSIAGPTQGVESDYQLADGVAVLASAGTLAALAIEPTLGSTVSAAAGTVTETVLTLAPVTGSMATAAAGLTGFAISTSASVLGQSVSAVPGIAVVSQLTAFPVTGAAMTTAAGTVLVPFQTAVTGAAVSALTSAIALSLTPGFAGASVTASAGAAVPAQASAVSGASASTAAGPITPDVFAAFVGASAITFAGNVTLASALGVSGAAAMTAAGSAAMGVTTAVSGASVAAQAGAAVLTLSTVTQLIGASAIVLAGSVQAVPLYQTAATGAAAVSAAGLTLGTFVRYATRGAALAIYTRGAALPAATTPPPAAPIWPGWRPWQ